MATNTYVALDKVTVSGSSTTTVTFSSIPSTYTDLVIVADFATSTAGAQTVFYFNGVTTGTPYSTTEIYGTGSGSAASYRFSSQNYIWLSSGVGSGSTLGQTNMIINVKDYANSTTHKTTVARENSNSGTYPGTLASMGLWRSTAAVTSVSIKADTGSTTFAAGSTFSLYGIASADRFAKATGGYIYDDSTYWYHAFSASGTFRPKESLSCDILVVAGGGGGGAIVGGGGGAGGLLAHTSQSLTATDYTVTVGGGGAGRTSASYGVGTNGSNSQFGSLTASVGGGGGAGINANPNSGGSGGGTGRSDVYTTPGAGTSGQGYAGGINVSGTQYQGAGGGGAGAVGTNATTTAFAGAGGIGATSSFINAIGAATNIGQLVSSNYYLAGGGGGGTGSAGATIANVGAGGAGGGGTGGFSDNTTQAGVDATSGTANTGGGGGGSRNDFTAVSAGAGGSGVVVIRYAK